MPYISHENRAALDAGDVAMHSGELNYLFTKIADKYLTHHGLSYQRINDLVGALEGAKFELNRRVTASYEDKKIKENGDVYGIKQQVPAAGPAQELRREGIEL